MCQNYFQGCYHYQLFYLLNYKMQYSLAYQDITQVKSEHDLPKELKDYIAFIESFVKVPIKLISVGPDRIQTIYRDK